MSQPERIQAVVIGGGQAGLSTGYLARHGIEFVILEAHQRIGDSWRNRWDSLRLFTPARFDGLAGMPFPAPANSFPTKDAMAGYLEANATRFRLPVRTGTQPRSALERRCTRSRRGQLGVRDRAGDRPRRPSHVALFSTLSSTMIHGVGRDARRAADSIASRTKRLMVG